MGNEVKKNSYPLIPVKNTVVFPSTSLMLLLAREHSVAAMKESQLMGKEIVVAAELPDKLKLENDIKQIYLIGTLCRIDNVMGNDKTGYQVFITGLKKFEISSISKKNTWLEVVGNKIEEEDDKTNNAIAMFNTLKKITLEMLSNLPENDGKITGFIKNINSQSELAYTCATQMRLEIEEAQHILELKDIREKLKVVLEKVNKQLDLLLIQNDILEKMSRKMDRTKKTALLREQLEAIKEELGETETTSEHQFKKKLDKIILPDDVRKAIDEEIKKLNNINRSSPEYHISHSYLTYILDMPWDKSSQTSLNLNDARKILDDHHYGMEKIKKRILSFLAVLKLNNEKSSPILCLFGPPGVGKTSLGKSIAEVLGRNFVRVSLGGVRDESEIRGHRRTYIGAMAGRLIHGIKRAGTNNPVMLLDEIDKLGSSFQGDPAAALLEVLDPEQNKSFLDHYVDLGFDLSKVFFICTANQLGSIPAPLRDRMEIIEISGYTPDEKVNIAKRFILPEVLDESGLINTKLEVKEDVLSYIVDNYTREAGVRELKRQIEALARGIALELVKEKEKFIHIDKSKVHKYLGPEKFEGPQILPSKVPGIVAGLAWTPFGGEVLNVECIKVPGTGKLEITGQLGDVMKESAYIARGYMLSIFSLLRCDFEPSRFDLHLHVPAGAVPKDGPSAGIAMLTALISIVIGKRVPQDLAMTGELTLTGSVLPVGGIKEKVIAAHRSGMKKIILPRKNSKDLIDVPNEITESMEFRLVDSANHVIEYALGVKFVDEILDKYYEESFGPPTKQDILGNVPM